MTEYIYGKNAVAAYLRSGTLPKAMYLMKGGHFEEIEALAQQFNVEIRYVKRDELNHKVKGVHQGVVLEIAGYDYAPLDDLLKGQHQLLVVCDQLEDPHNLGAILRTADAVGVDGVIVGKNRSVGLNATVAKVSTGAINSVKVAQVTNLVQTLERLKKEGYWIVAAENGVQAVDYRKFAVDMPLVLVVGSEGRGISQRVLKTCDILTTIPMQGTVNSLNVSVATAVLLYEILRRRNE